MSGQISFLHSGNPGHAFLLMKTLGSECRKGKIQHRPFNYGQFHTCFTIRVKRVIRNLHLSSPPPKSIAANEQQILRCAQDDKFRLDN